MARLQRTAPPGIPHHVIQRGNNRQVCFVGDQDRALYANLIDDYSKKFSVSIHGWVFITNHIHLLVTPNEENTISSMMQALGRRYVEIGRSMGEADGVELDDTKWQQILKAREYYEDNAVVPPIRKFAKYIGTDQKEIFKMWMSGPMKPITKYGGLPKPTGCV